MNEQEKQKAIIGRDLDVLDNAIEALERETKLHAEKKRLDVNIAGRRIDATLQIKGPTKKIEYFVEIKRIITDATIGKLALRFAETPGRWLLVTNYVPSHLARRMKELNIQFIDAAGNAYLHEKPLLVFVHGNKPDEKFVTHKSDLIWGRAGVKIVFALLCNDGLVNAPYREVANKADVGIGTLTQVFNGLIKLGFLLDRGAWGRRLQRKKELFDKWIEAYALRLRPKTLYGLYTADREGFWQQGDALHNQAHWGGEVAANQLTHYLKPEIITIYAHKPLNDLVLNLRLRKNPQGNVELRERFWRFEHEEKYRGMVPPILVYADLMATADARNIETAKMIYEEHLERRLRGD